MAVFGKTALEITLHTTTAEVLSEDLLACRRNCCGEAEGCEVCRVRDAILEAVAQERELIDWNRARRERLADERREALVEPGPVERELVAADVVRYAGLIPGEGLPD